MPWKLVAGQMKQLGFEPGWGKNVGIVRQRLHELLDILEVCADHPYYCILHASRLKHDRNKQADHPSRCIGLLQAPDDETLGSFLGALPMMFSIAILSPHGFFGQSGECRSCCEQLPMPASGKPLMLTLIVTLNA